jgi:hypothetical protein
MILEVRAFNCYIVYCESCVRHLRREESFEKALCGLAPTEEKDVLH